MKNSNPTTNRRRFLETAATGAAWLLSPSLVTRMAAQSPESRVDILLNEPVGTIAPEIYGHFVEHLGGVVYDGIWVGEGSRIPNVNGLRKQLVDALKRVQPGIDSLAGRLLRRPVRLARRHRSARQTPQAYQLLDRGRGVAERRAPRRSAGL
jgi:hypothetical protein